MFELAMIHRPGIVDGRQDLGRILEAMLYYDRVHLMMSGQMFSALWDILGPDDLFELVTHPSVTTTLTSEMLAVKNEIGPLIVTHRPIAMKMSGRSGKLIDVQDDVGSLLQMLEGLPNRPGGTWSQVNRIAKKAKLSRYSKILGGSVASHERFLSLVRDETTLKLFLRGWAMAEGKQIREAALEHAHISAIEIGDEIMVSSTIDPGLIVTDWDPRETWGRILNHVQDFAVDLYLSQAYGADIVTDPAVAEVASARLDVSLQRAMRNRQEISAFETLVFEEAHGFADGVNRGLLTFAEALKAIDQSRRFRAWTKGIAPDANLIVEYHRAISKEPWVKRLPASIARFAIFNGTGMLADAAAPGTGLIASAMDSFVVDRLMGGWRPNVFVRNLQKTLVRAGARAG